MNIKPFTAHVAPSVLEDLALKIKLTRWPDTVSGSGWSYGSDISYMKELAEYWLQRFNWRAVERQINAHPNFMAHISGFDIHFLHIKGKGKRSMPLLITHGWPGSFLEMMELIPLLTEDPENSFDLVIPSVPGFGFSGKPAEPGCSSSVMAGLWYQLMTELGYTRWGAQGGDIGSGISTWLSLQHPEHITGLHLNFIPGSYKPYLAEGEKLTEEVSAFQQQRAAWLEKEGAYAHMHATKPQTAAYGLNDSPVGLCAWIIEKFRSWSDNNGELETRFTKDQLLANVTLYWVTQTIHSSMRIYYENSLQPLAFREGGGVKVPVAYARFPRELPTPPRSFIEKGFNIRHWTEMPRGGHFAAAEEPALLAKDIRDFFVPLF